MQELIIKLLEKNLTTPRKKFWAIVTGFVVAGIILLSLLFSVGIVFVIIHFIAKFW